MNSETNHKENHTYLLWPIVVLLLLTIGVFLTTREPFEVMQKISLLDNNLALIFLVLFLIVFAAGIFFFFRKKS